MENAWFRVSDKVLLEFIYNSKTLSTNTHGFKKIFNPYENSNTITNQNSSLQETGNVTDFTVVELDNGKQALLDNDAAFYYPAYDPNIVINDITFVSPHVVQYDTVRLHLVSGYNFDDFQGFSCSFFLRSGDNRKIRIANISFFKGNTELLYFNPKPRIISELVYDKYIEFDIPSADSMIDQQELLPADTNTLAYKFTDGKLFSSQRQMYCSFSLIRNIDNSKGVFLLDIDDSNTFVFNTSDQFNLLTADITENSKGFFEYQAKWNSGSLEDFMFSLNSMAGNDYYIIHELIIIAQRGLSFSELERFSIVQNSDYDVPKKYKPIFATVAGIDSISVDYYVRLYNRANGQNILKTASVSSLTPNKYSEDYSVKLNVGDVNQPITVVNKIIKKDNIIQNNENYPVQTKISYVFVDSNTVTLGSNTNITINPFDNIFRFAIQNTSGESIELDTISNYYLIFLLDDNTKLYTSEILSSSFKKTEGELVFQLDSERSKQVLGLKNKQFYVISKSPNSIETVIASGYWSEEIPVTNETI